MVFLTFLSVVIFGIDKVVVFCCSVRVFEWIELVGLGRGSTEVRGRVVVWLGLLRTKYR